MHNIIHNVITYIHNIQYTIIYHMLHEHNDHSLYITLHTYIHIHTNTHITWGLGVRIWGLGVDN